MSKIRHESVAKEACDYARNIISRCGTALHDEGPQEERETFYQGLTIMREKFFNKPPFILEENDAIRRYFQLIENCKKYRMGNCTEYAILALEYVSANAPDIEAEYFHISGGDHAFLVIGRTKNSNPSDPTTWGENAFICDPWANKVFHASNYLQELGNYYDLNSGTSYTEAFDPKRHSLATLMPFNTRFIRQSQSQSHIDFLKDNLREKSLAICLASNHLVNKLVDIEERLIKNYGENNPKYMVIKKMRENLQLAADTIESELKEDENKPIEDQIPFQELENKLLQRVKRYTEAVKTTIEEKKTLSEYNNENTYKTRMMQFFHIAPKTVRDTNAALKEAHQRIQALGSSPL